MVKFLLVAAGLLYVTAAPGSRGVTDASSRPPASIAASSNARIELFLDQGWRFREAGTEAWYPARVPGTVHTDLLAAGLIPDPFFGDNENKLQWIETRDWEYRTTFTPPTAVLRQRHAELVFEGLDTYADVSLNGQPVLTANNMFRTWVVDVSGQLHPGENTLTVLFHSPVHREEQLAAAYPRRLPADSDPHGTRVFTRKAAYQYSWDWGPRFVTDGIWRPVRLRAWTGAVLRDVFIQQRSLTDRRAELRAQVQLQADTSADATVVVRSPAHAFDSIRRTIHLHPGVSEVALDFGIDQPHRWWPNGLGEAYLYPVTTAVEMGGATLDTLGRRMGLRTVRVDTATDSIGNRFTVLVNGVPVFMKGANYIPLDHFTPRADSARYRQVFRDVAAAHMNMLRVWGGGIYERNLFYDLADENGILVWQDFMFANGMYPSDSSFLANVRAEAVDQVRRLRNHSSLALWCGNNEVREGWENWNWPRRFHYSPADSAAVWAGYHRIFEGILPAAVDSLDPGRFYWPTTPTIAWGHPESLTHYDAHYWGVWAGAEPLEVFLEKLPRFMAEFGFQAYPPMATIEAFTNPADRRVASPVMEVHQKHLRGDTLIHGYMSRWFPEPKDFASFVYVSQVLQAEGMKLAFEAHRRALPRTMGSLYWQLDDTWPVISWSSEDYFGRWKALQYYVRRAFAPVLVSPVIEGDDVRIQIVSDRLRTRSGTLVVRVVPFTGGETFRAEHPVTIPANRSVTALNLPLPQLLRNVDPGSAVLVAELRLEDGSAVRNLLYFREPKDEHLPDPGLQTSLRRDGAAILVDLRARALARAVSLSFDGIDGHFSDDFFDLLPGESRTIRFTPATTPGANPRLRVQTLVDAW